MKIRTLALVLGSAAVMALSGMAATACSSSSSPATGGGSDSGSAQDSTSGSDTGMTGDDSSAGNDTGSGGGDGGIDCGSIPTLHQSEAGVIGRCGFDDAGTAFGCAVGQECCVGAADKTQPTGFDPEQCQAWGSACTNGPEGGIPLECEQNADCTANDAGSGAVCCMKGGSAATVQGCGYPKAKGSHDVVCEQGTNGACPNNDLQICQSQADCPTGKTCTAGKWLIYQLGFCM